MPDARVLGSSSKLKDSERRPCFVICIPSKSLYSIAGYTFMHFANRPLIWLWQKVREAGMDAGLGVSGHG